MRSNRNSISQFCLRKQHLYPGQVGGSPEEMLEDLFVLHSTSAITPFLSLKERNDGFRQGDLLDAMLVRRSIIKMRVVRTTVHLVGVRSVPYILAATGDRTEKKSEQFTRYVGVSREEYELYSSAILEGLGNRGMNSEEIREMTGFHGNLPGILSLLCDRMKLVRTIPPGNWRSNQHIYYRTRYWLPSLETDPVPMDEGIDFIVENYLRAYGPATEEDIVWWTGLGRQKIRNSLGRLAGGIVRLEVRGEKEDFYCLAAEVAGREMDARPGPDPVNLLPAADPYIMAYRNRNRYMDAGLYPFVFDRAGNGTHVILVSGMVAGVWDYSDKPAPSVFVLLFGKESRKTRDAVYAKARDRGRFIFGEDPELVMVDDMDPLAERTVGSFMSPLRNLKTQ